MGGREWAEKIGEGKWLPERGKILAEKSCVVLDHRRKNPLKPKTTKMPERARTRGSRDYYLTNSKEKEKHAQKKFRSGGREGGPISLRAAVTGDLRGGVVFLWWTRNRTCRNKKNA